MIHACYMILVNKVKRCFGKGRRESGKNDTVPQVAHCAEEKY